MYVAHPTFVQPSDEHIKVWRYMDFTKLVSLFDTQSLFFTRADKFDDPFEGSWPKANVSARQQIPDSLLLPEHRENYTNSIAKLSEMCRSLPKFTAVNCWHMNEHESAAMWKLYLKSNEGIAVQSTYQKFRSAITDDRDVYVGIVEYIDYEIEGIDARNLFAPFVHKRKSFEHEREVRALVTTGKWPSSITEEPIEQGLKLTVNVESLVDLIYLAPNSPDWFADLVKSVVLRYGYNFQVVHSKLNERPVF